MNRRQLLLGGAGALVAPALPKATLVAALAISNDMGSTFGPAARVLADLNSFIAPLGTSTIVVPQNIHRILVRRC